MHHATTPAAARLALLLACALLLARAAPDSENVARVPVDLFVMSKCPDAVFCEGHLQPVLQELKSVIDLQLHFIGLKQDDGSWQCKHGEEECKGDLQQLCVQVNSKLYQRYDWLFAFTLCNNKAGLDQTGSFATATKCLKDAGIPLAAATKMLGCMYAPGSSALLEADFATTAALGVSTSCTVAIDGNTVCVRDGGEWKDCAAGSSQSDFKELLCASYAAKNRGRLPRQCRDIPVPPAAVAVQRR